MTSEDIYVPFFRRREKREEMHHRSGYFLYFYLNVPSRLQTQKKNATQDEGSLFHRRCYVSPAREWLKKYVSQNVWAKIAMHSLRVQHCDRHAKIDVSGSTI